MVLKNSLVILVTWMLAYDVALFIPFSMGNYFQSLKWQWCSAVVPRGVAIPLQNGIKQRMIKSKPKWLNQ